MPNSTFVARGDVIEYPTGTALSAGDSIQLDPDANFVGVVVADTAANDTAALYVTGRFDMPKNSASDVMAVGDVVAITVTAGAATVATSSAGKHMVSKASANGDTTVEVLLNCGMEGS